MNFNQQHGPIERRVRGQTKGAVPAQRKHNGAPFSDTRRDVRRSWEPVSLFDDMGS